MVRLSTHERGSWQAKHAFGSMRRDSLPSVQSWVCPILPFNLDHVEITLDVTHFVACTKCSKWPKLLSDIWPAFISEWGFHAIKSGNGARHTFRIVPITCGNDWSGCYHSHIPNRVKGENHAYTNSEQNPSLPLSANRVRYRYIGSSPNEILNMSQLGRGKWLMAAENCSRVHCQCRRWIGLFSRRWPGRYRLRVQCSLLFWPFAGLLFH